MSINFRGGFGPQKQDIDLAKYKDRWSDEEIQRHSKRGKFIQFAFLDLKKFGGDIVCEELNNMAIRKDGNRDNVDKDIAYSFERIGWSFDPFPPIVNTSFELQDGRTRVRAAILAGCTFIPVAVFSYPDSDPSVAYVQNLSEALIGNDDLISRPTKEGDLFEAAVAAVTGGGIDHDKTAISDLLLKEFEALRFIKQDRVSDLVDNIFDAVKGGQRAVWNPSRDDVLTYLKKCPDLPKDVYFNGKCVNGKKVYVYSSGETNRGRLWTKISKDVPEDCYVVLYTTDKIPSRIKSGYEDFMSFVEMRYKECFEIVNRTAFAAGINIKIEPPAKRPWKLLGVIPQLNNTTHETLRKAHRLIQVEDC